MKRRDPRTAAEWQEAVDLSAGSRLIADCQMYGLIEGGVCIDVARCDELLERGRRLGVVPSRPAVEIALDIVRARNSE